MENKFENIDEVIARFLSGESTEPDRRLLQEWRELSEENNREYLQFEKNILSQWRITKCSECRYGCRLAKSS
ncbi:MAG: hypothetical protein U0X76_02190 [Bacteroidia bacterium]